MNLDDKVMIPTDVAKIIIGPIPFVVPYLEKQEREWAGDDVWRHIDFILEPAFDAPSSKLVSRKLEKWGKTYYDFPVAVTCFENLVKVQKESGFMQGIVGITTDMANVAVKADYVRNAVKTGSFDKYFKEISGIYVSYGFRDDFDQYPTACAENVVLFPYNDLVMELDGDQFRAINAKAVPRDKIPQGYLTAEEIFQNNKVIYPYSDIFPKDIAVSLINKTYQFGKENFGYDALMGFFLPEVSEGNNPEMRALFVDMRSNRSGLSAAGLGNDKCRLVGVLNKK